MIVSVARCLVRRVRGVALLPLVWGVGRRSFYAVARGVDYLLNKGAGDFSAARAWVMAGVS